MKVGKEKLNNSFVSDDEANNAKNTNDDIGPIRKSKTVKNPTKIKAKKESKKKQKESIENKRKVKFNNDIQIIDVESWKKYNLEQTADENFGAFLYEESEDDKDKTKKDKKNNIKKIKEREGNVSCTCNIF